MELLGAPAWLPELFPAFTLTQWHDIGIALASIGLVFMYLPITLTLVIVEQKETRTVRIRSRLIHFLSHGDFFNIVGFFGLFLAAGGVWFCMHQAFLYQGEYLKGTLPSNIYIFLIYEITPIMLHLIGNLLIMIGLITIASIITIKVVIRLLSQLGRLE